MIYNITQLENLLGRGVDRYTLLDQEQLAQFSQATINEYCFKYGFWLLPTTELINFLLPRFTTKFTEFGAGAGLISKFMPGRNIFNVDPCYDAAILRRVDGVVPITYPSDVIRKTAEEFLREQRVLTYNAFMAFVPTSKYVKGVSANLSVILHKTSYGSLYFIYDTQREPDPLEFPSNWNALVTEINSFRIFGRGSGNYRFVVINKQFDPIDPLVNETNADSVREENTQMSEILSQQININTQILNGFDRIAQSLSDSARISESVIERNQEILNSQERISQVLVEASVRVAEAASKNLEASDTNARAASINLSASDLKLSNSLDSNRK